MDLASAAEKKNLFAFDNRLWLKQSKIVEKLHVSHKKYRSLLCFHGRELENLYEGIKSSNDFQLKIFIFFVTLSFTLTKQWWGQDGWILAKVFFVCVFQGRI